MKQSQVLLLQCICYRYLGILVSRTQVRCYLLPETSFFCLFFFFCVKGSKEFYSEKPAFLKVSWLRQLLRGFFCFLWQESWMGFAGFVLGKTINFLIFGLFLKTISSVAQMNSAVWKTGETTTLQDSGKQKPSSQKWSKREESEIFSKLFVVCFLFISK